MFQILVAEDDKNTRRLMEAVLKEHGYHPILACDGLEALKLLDTHHVDLVILDIMMPGMDGYELTRQLRATDYTLPILMVTAKQLPEDKRKGFIVGTDDYMTKPFSVSELLARVEALVRRVGRQGASSAAPEPDGRMVSGVFVLDQKSRVLYKNGTPIDLTQVEFQIMELFFANPGVALVREKILEGVWGENYFGDVKIVDVNIRRLRMKIEDEPSAPKHILTVWGYGYRWNA